MKKDIFQKVAQSERRRLFQEALQQKLLFHSKGDAEEVVTLVLTEYYEDKLLVFEYAQGSPQFKGIQSAVMNFAVAPDRYFFQTQVEAFQNRVMVNADLEVFILQRRKTPRVDIPDDFSAQANITQHAQRPCWHNCKILDFSSGGCRLRYGADLPPFKVGDSLKLVLHLSYRRPLELEAVIRHHVSDPASSSQVFGIQFVLPNSILENKLFVTFLDVQRELFSKWST